MSHFDDVEPLFWGSGPSSVIGVIAFLVVAGIAVIWAASADEDSKNLCESHGERYLDSNSTYTLCEQDGGAVVRR